MYGLDGGMPSRAKGMSMGAGGMYTSAPQHAGRWMDRDDDQTEFWGDELNDATWAGGTGFEVNEVVQKWKGTSRICFFWPLHSESLTLTTTEVHVKRNECPALPRECRPYRSWAVAPLYKISAFRMSKETFRPVPLILLLFFSVGVGFALARLILFFQVEYSTTTHEITPTTTSLDFFVAGIIMVVACCVGYQFINLCAPLRLKISVDGADDWFGIDLVPGKVQPDEIKKAISAASAEAAAP